MKTRFLLTAAIVLFSSFVLRGATTSDDEYNARLNIEKRNISWSEGIGINADFKSGALFNDAEFKKRITELKPAVIRWGDLDANMYGFEKVTGPDSGGDYASSIGIDRKNKGLATHAMNMDYCNEIEAFYSLCVGLKDGQGGFTKEANNWSVDYIDSENGYKVFQNLIEYLAGPESSPYGAKRAEEGFAEPLLQKGKSKGLILEFGHEVWGGQSHNAHMGSDRTRYGQWCLAMVDAIHASPYWSDIKELVYFSYSGDISRALLSSHSGMNGIRGGNSEDIQLLGTSVYPDFNVYNCCLDEMLDFNNTPIPYYQQTQNSISLGLKHIQYMMEEQMVLMGGPLGTYISSAYVGYKDKDYFGKLGQAVMLNDYLTASLKYGGAVPSIYKWYAKHEESDKDFRINKGDTPLAHYEIARLINTYCKGHLVGSNIETDNTLFHRTSLDQLKPIDGYDPVGTSVYNNGKQWSVLLFSRDFENKYSVQLNLPDNIGAIKNAKRFMVTVNGTEPDHLVEENFVSKEESVTLANGDMIEVPPFSMVLYTFEADDPEFEKLPLGNFDRIKPETLELSGDFFINTDKGSTKISVAVTPDNAFSKGIIWDISEAVNGHMEGCKFPTLSVSQEAVTVRAQGSDLQGYVPNGEFWLKATFTDNPSISKTAHIVISNQTALKCGRISVDGTETENLLVYPNPAEDVLYVQTASGGLSTATIYNVAGTRLMSETGSELIEMNISGLAAGNYIVKVAGAANSTASFVKK